VLAAASAAQLDDRLVLGFAGVEIMRRLIGVAQLPLPYGLDVKSRLLALSAHLVLARDRSLDWW
jgi:5-methylthioribose kinase